ncbi:MAG: DUF6036 family nucleotidyltransferase [bacterium]|nr:DUF6036 family nucleotidyltransferase [bacterium]
MSEPASEFFDAERLKALFDEVDAELGDGEPIRVVACGGAVMIFKYNIRRTNDVDVISEPFPLELHQATEAVAQRRGLAERWMNEAAKISVPRIAPRLETVYQGRRLEVLSPGPHFLLAMKLAAGRDRDLPDAAMLMDEIGFANAEEVLDLIEEAWGHTQLSTAVEYFAREAFEMAQQGAILAPPDAQRFAPG